MHTGHEVQITVKWQSREYRLTVRCLSFEGKKREYAISGKNTSFLMHHYPTEPYVGPNVVHPHWVSLSEKVSDKAYKSFMQEVAIAIERAVMYGD